MLKKDFDLFKQKYLKDCCTQSHNSSILELYSLLLEREHWDSDYWYEEHGASDIIRIFEMCFTDDDWNELEKDLNNWTGFQLELFTLAILGGYYSYTLNGVYYEQYDIERLTRTVQNRLNLLIPIIKIENERNSKSLDLSGLIIENINFITDHFDLLIAKSNKNLDTVQTIIALLKIAESKEQNIIDLKNKIERYK